MPLVLTDLVVEDGTGLTTANSYVSLTYAEAYFERHFYAQSWVRLDLSKKLAALMQSSRILDSVLTPSVQKLVQTSGLLFPRADGVGVPAWLKQATCEQVLMLIEKNRLLPTTRGVGSQSVGGASVSYTVPAAEDVISSYVRSLIAPYCMLRGSIGMAKLLRV